MSIIYSTGKKITEFPVMHDPGDSKYYTFVYRPKVRVNSTLYYLDDVVIPAVANGYMYQCINPGISGASAPSYATKVNGKTTDGTIVWLALPYNLLLNSGDAITSNTFTATAGVTLTNTSESNGTTSVKVAVTPALTSFILSNRISVIRADSKEEYFERSIEVTVGEL